MQHQFNESELPIADFGKLGLLVDGKPALSQADQEALLAGHRTDLITIRDLHGDGIHIRDMQAKLSLERTGDGPIAVQLHPIYREARRHPLLLDEEADALKKGTLSHVLKSHKAADGRQTSWSVEYDPQTREFVSLDPSRVQVPEKINNQQLSAVQKEDYRNGAVVELADGTQLQRRASNRSGVTSNRTALVYSLILDGGVSYLLLRGLDNLFNSNSRQLDPISPGYQKAMEKMRKINDQGKGFPDKQTKFIEPNNIRNLPQR